MKNTVYWYVTPCDYLRTKVSEGRITYIIGVARIGDQGTILSYSISSQRASVAIYC
jgi:hypothetical protein